MKGYDVVVVRDVKYHPTQFQPYIYSDDEVNRFFAVVDSYYSSRNRKDAIQYPILFRILYSCGTRISETLYIQKRDVDLVRGIIRLIETKNGEERFIALGKDLQNLMRKFADKCFYLLAADDYIFTNAYGGRLDVKSVYEKHRLSSYSPICRQLIKFRFSGSTFQWYTDDIFQILEIPNDLTAIFQHDFYGRFIAFHWKQLYFFISDAYLRLVLLIF